MNTEIRALNELVQKESAFVDALLGEANKVIVGQRYMLDRVLIGLLCSGHVLLEGVPGLAKTLTVKTLAETLDAQFSRIQFTPDLLARRPHRHADLQPGDRELRRAQGAGVRQHHPRRRDQPRARQGAERAARGDAGAPGHHRRPDLSAARRRSSCWPPRTRSSRKAPIPCPKRRSTASCSRCWSATPPARKSGRSSTAWPPALRPGPARSSAPTTCFARAAWSTRSTWIDKIKDYIVNLVFATREPASTG